MSDDRSTFEVTRARLDDIVVQVRRKDVSLEQSLDLLEEAVRLVNQCNDLIDQTSFRPAPVAEEAEAPLPETVSGDVPEEPPYEPGADDAVLAEIAAEAVAQDADAEGAPEGDVADDEPTGNPEGDEHEDIFGELGEVSFMMEDDERE